MVKHGEELLGRQSGQNSLRKLAFHCFFFDRGLSDSEVRHRHFSFHDYVCYSVASATSYLEIRRDNLFCKLLSPTHIIRQYFLTLKHFTSKIVGNLKLIASIVSERIFKINVRHLHSRRCDIEWAMEDPLIELN